MVLIIEIVLTIVAWTRGWKVYALIPLGSAIGIGLLIGLVIGSTGGCVDDVGGVIVLDLIAILILAFMCFKKREVKKSSHSSDE